MRFFFLILVFSTFLAKDIASFSWQMWFYTHQKEIAAEKCENKAVPMMHCDGKCYLSKQLKKLEQKEQKHNSKTNPFQKIEKIELAQTFTEFSCFYLVNQSPKINCFGYKDSFSKKHLNKIFHPPTI